MQAYIPGLFNPDGSGPPLAWDQAIEALGAGQMQYIKKVVLDRKGDYFSRVPAQDILVGDTGANENHIVATRDSDGQWALVYTPTGKPFQVRTASLKPKGNSTNAQWFDPVSGTYSSLELGSDSAEVRTFTPPRNTTHADWVLVLE